MTYKISNPQSQLLRLRLLSFSPDDQFHQQNHTNNTKPKSNPNSDLLYQVYHNQLNARTTRKESHNQLFIQKNKNHFKPSNNPEITLTKTQVQPINQFQLQSQSNKLRAKSSHQINTKKYYISIDLPSKPQINYMVTPNKQDPSKTLLMNPSSTNTISFQTNYISSKQTFHKLSKSRIQEQKDLTFLSRTFLSVRKSQQKTKKKILTTFAKKMEKQTRQRQKLETKRRHEQWLQNQKNQNSTKKYMNHLLKYQAKKSLIDKNIQQAQLMRSRLKSQESVKSQRSLILSHEKKQKAYLMKAQNLQSIQKAKMRTVSRIKSRSNSVRNEMTKVYQCQGELEAWRIGQIDERSKLMLATIEKSKRNKEVLQKVLKESRNMNSAGIYETLTRTLRLSKESSKI